MGPPVSAAVGCVDTLVADVVCGGGGGGEGGWFECYANL
jgi:hypothetical protein